jgi:asparagine synthase (glutamine-hydrolysing)
MCGILGSINLSLSRESLDLMAHRGPDGQGFELFNVGRHRLILGHRRLAIVDLSSAGSQPMITDCGNYALVFNGEIYNHAELREHLPRERFRGHSDTETCLHYMAANGADALADFNGIFGIGFLDLRRRKLFLARDPFGVKPLYYWMQNDAFMFSSELRPIQNRIHDDIDHENLAELLRLRYSPSPDTLFRNIRKVRPGHFVEIDLSGDHPVVSEHSFVRPQLQTEDISFEEAQRRYGELVCKAVERQLMSDVEVGVLLSGGVDSALIASIAQKHSSYQMKAFTVGFDQQCDTDEVADAAETARIVGLKHSVVRMGEEDFFAGIRAFVSFVEEPLATTSLVPMFHLARLAGSQVKVVLSGQGADEAMGGYRKYQLEVLRRFMPPIGGARVAALMSSMGVRHDAVLRGVRAIAERDPLRRMLDGHTVFSPPEIRALIGTEDTRSLQRIKYFYDLLDCTGERDPVAAILSVDLRTALPDDLLLYTDKMTMRHSIECRVPLLDCDLVKFVETLPSHFRVRLGGGKILHKQFAETLLPAEIVQRKKKGFFSPTDMWFRRSGKLREILLNRNSAFASLFDLNRVEQVLTEHENGFTRSRQIFLLLSIYYWLIDVYSPSVPARVAPEQVLVD